MAGEHPSEPTLLAYVEDELDAAARETVEAHLAECAACAADVALARAGRDAARAAPLLEAPAGLADRVAAETRPRASQRPATARRWLGIVAPVAAALAIAGGIATLAVYTPGGGDDSEAGEGAAIAEESAGDTGGGQEAPEELGASSGRPARTTRPPARARIRPSRCLASPPTRKISPASSGGPASTHSPRARRSSSPRIASPTSGVPCATTRAAASGSRSSSRVSRLGQVEVERVEELDGRRRRVDGDVGQGRSGAPRCS